MPNSNLVGGSLSFPAETKLPRIGYLEGVEILLLEEDAEENAVRGYDEPGDTTSIDCCVLGDAAI